MNSAPGEIPSTFFSMLANVKGYCQSDFRTSNLSRSLTIEIDYRLTKEKLRIMYDGSLKWFSYITYKGRHDLMFLRVFFLVVKDSFHQSVI